MIHLKYVSYNIAKALKRIGYNEGTSQCITQYEDDFVYDGDPNDPESHKAGDIRSYHIYFRNSDTDYGPNMCEMPTLVEVQTWLREKKNINIDIIAIFTYSTGNRYAYGWNVYAPTTEDSHTLEIIDTFKLMNKDYDNALADALWVAIKYLEKNEQEN